MWDSILNGLRGLIVNWKTTLSGLCVLILLALYLANKITKEQMEYAVVTLIGIGLMSAKDGNVTGGSKTL